jgi:hypothetical protein
MARVLKEQLDQSPLAGSKLPMHTTPCKAMQQRHGLLREKFFEFLGGHVFLMKCEV